MNPTIADRLTALGLSHEVDVWCAPGARAVRDKDGTLIGRFSSKGLAELIEELETKEQRA